MHSTRQNVPAASASVLFLAQPAKTVKQNVIAKYFLHDELPFEKSYHVVFIAYATAEVQGQNRPCQNFIPPRPACFR